MRRVLIIWLVLLAGTLSAGIRILSSTDQQLIVEFRMEPYTLVSESDMLRMDVSGMDFLSVSGAPLLPYAEIKVGIPSGGSATARVLSSDAADVTLQKRLAPVPKVLLDSEVSRSVYEIDETLYGNRTGQVINPLPAAVFRGHAFVPIQIWPVQYDGQRQLKVHTQIIFAIDINGNTEYRAEPVNDDLGEILLDQLVNPSQARYWYSQNRETINHAPFAASDYWIRLETDRDGIYKITYSQLNAFPLSDVDPASFRLFTTGGSLLPFQIQTAGPEFKEIPIHVVDGEDGNFDAEDHILFYGTNRDGTAKNQGLSTNSIHFNPYSGNAVYWLTFGGEFNGDPLRIQTLPEPATWDAESTTNPYQARLETETYRRDLIGFEWFMTRMFGMSTAEYEFTIDLPEVDATQTQLLSFMIQQEEASTDSWHTINVYVNDMPILFNQDTGSIDFSWLGIGEYLFQRNVSSFVSGNNTIRIRVNRTTTDNLYLNYITVDYTRLNVKSTGQVMIRQTAQNNSRTVRYSVQGSLNPDIEVYMVNGFSDVTKLTGSLQASVFTFKAGGPAGTVFILTRPSEYLSPLNIASIDPVDLVEDLSQLDNVIITADEYATQAQTLADIYYDRWQMRSKVVKLSDVFNQFNGGHPDPAAVRLFLRHLYFNLPSPRIKTATLIGLGTIDWRNFSGLANSRNKFIVYQRGSIASDDYFAMMSSSLYPELAIGRYPVRSVNELDNMISNFQRYTANDTGGWWRNSMVMLGDDLFNGSTGSYESIHTRQVESAGNLVHPSILVDKIFAWEYEYDEFQNKPGARDDMLAAINDGRLLWYYIGHGSYDKLGAEDYFNGATDMGRFSNPDKLPVFLAASCKVSHFDYWGFESLGQKVVLLNNLGAIASYSATRISAPYSNGPMMEFLLNNLANLRNPLGYSIMAAKISYTQSNDNDATYVLLGDPNLRVIPPVRDSLMTFSAMDRKDKATLYSRQTVAIDGSLRPFGGSGTADVRVYDASMPYYLDWLSLVSHRGPALFRGTATIEAGEYTASFIVPDDVTSADNGIVISYFWDNAGKQDYVNYSAPLAFSDQAVATENLAPPEISLFLGSMDFRPGDTVSTNTILLAKISDANGVNITGSSGHNILLVIDNSIQPIPVTQYFNYDQDSHTTGLLRYPLTGLSEGSHSIQLIAFDNFNLPSVASTDFIARKSGELSIERLLIYPNPMRDEGDITFILSEDSDLEISLFTVTGKKVRTIKTIGRQGFNTVRWDGRDENGNQLANNTYFVRVSAKSGTKKTEARERLVIYK